MKRACFAWIILLIVMGSYPNSSASDKYMDIQTGDEIYACNCGKDCGCHSMAKVPGNCTCGQEMVKARVVKAGGGTAILISDVWGRMRIFKMVGNYSCEKCGMVSQEPGNCCCGEEMK